MSAEIRKKFKIASDLFEMAFKIKSHQLRKKHPQASETEIKRMTLEAIEDLIESGRGHISPGQIDSWT